MSTILVPSHRQSFYHRTTIPKVLRPFFGGRVEYWRILCTTDKDEARLIKVRCLLLGAAARGRELRCTWSSGVAEGYCSYFATTSGGRISASFGSSPTSRSARRWRSRSQH